MLRENPVAPCIQNRQSDGIAFDGVVGVMMIDLKVFRIGNQAKSPLSGQPLKLEDSPFCQKDPKIKKQLLRILLRYYNTFSWDGSPGSTDLIVHEIPTKEGLPPIREPYR